MQSFGNEYSGAFIMLSSNDGNFEDTRIVDFGIAKLVDDSEHGGQHLTKTGELFGSPLYMSPEQCRGAKIDSRTDIYSMGCMMYETLTGQPPIKGATAVETLMKQVNDPAPSLSDSRRDIYFSPKLENIIRKALAKNPADRFQTMNDLELALMQVQTKSPDTVIVKWVVKQDAITDDGLDWLIEAPKLTDIFCDGTNITDRGLKKMKKDSKLEHLGITDCKHISAKEILSLEAALPKCEVMNRRHYWP